MRHYGICRLASIFCFLQLTSQALTLPLNSTFLKHHSSIPSSDETAIRLNKNLTLDDLELLSVSAEQDSEVSSTFGDSWDIRPSMTEILRQENQSFNFPLVRSRREFPPAYQYALKSFKNKKEAQFVHKNKRPSRPHWHYAHPSPPYIYYA